ncbi:hypothetical protein [Paenibacillus sp. GCM10027626]|uniref:hypothetical protein n=1 Tax=Paenibacillus sp. GCM10027626 TaxID=3273411 RepID=UPI00362C1F0D
MRKYEIYTVWIVALVIELIIFYNQTHSVHDVSDNLFMMTLIAVTLVVGATAIFSRHDKK